MTTIIPFPQAILAQEVGNGETAERLTETPKC